MSNWEKRGFFRVSKDLEKVADHPIEAKESLYGRTVIPLIIAVLRAQGVKMTIQNPEHIPAQGPALIAFNHTGYYDFIFGGTAAYVRGKRVVRFMAKKEIFDVPVVGKLMRGMKHISVDRFAGAASMDDAVDSLNQGNLVGIFPEGTISRSFEVKALKTGAVRIAQQADCPLIPAVIWGSQRLWSKGYPKKLGRNHFPVWVRIGEPVSTGGSLEESTERLRSAMQELLEQVRADYAAEYGPFADGENWMPASLGGSAPTIDEATVIETKERERRAQKRAEKIAAEEARAAQGSTGIAGKAKSVVSAIRAKLGK